MENKIIQIWEDNTHETALYPVSVVEAIKFNENVTLAQEINNLEEKIGLKVVELWRNASPGTQELRTISIDLTDYNAIILECRGRGDNASGTYYTAIGTKGGYITTLGGNSDSCDAKRKYSITNTGLSLVNSFSSYYTEYGVPVVVYGLK